MQGTEYDVYKRETDMSQSHVLKKFTVWQEKGDISSVLKIKDYRMQKKEHRLLRSLEGTSERRSYLNYSIEVLMGFR